MKKPASLADLPRPFADIGDSGWAGRCRDLLAGYGEPLPSQVSKNDVLHAEQRLSVSFPESYASLLRDLGAPRIAQFRFLGVEELRVLGSDSVHDAAVPGPSVICVAEMMDGTGDVFVLDCSSGKCGRHVLLQSLPKMERSVGDLLYYAMDVLAVSYWADESLDWMLDDIESMWD